MEAEAGKGAMAEAEELLAPKPLPPREATLNTLRERNEGSEAPGGSHNVVVVFVSCYWLKLCNFLMHHSKERLHAVFRAFLLFFSILLHFRVSLNGSLHLFLQHS